VAESSAAVPFPLTVVPSTTLSLGAVERDGDYAVAATLLDCPAAFMLHRLPDGAALSDPLPPERGVVVHRVRSRRAEWHREVSVRDIGSVEATPARGPRSAQRCGAHGVIRTARALMARLDLKRSLA